MWRSQAGSLLGRMLTLREQSSFLRFPPPANPLSVCLCASRDSNPEPAD
jgi:hypothetical protein